MPPKRQIARKGGRTQCTAAQMEIKKSSFNKLFGMKGIGTPEGFLYEENLKQKIKDPTRGPFGSLIALVRQKIITKSASPIAFCQA